MMIEIDFIVVSFFKVCWVYFQFLSIHSIVLLVCMSCSAISFTSTLILYKGLGLNFPVSIKIPFFSFHHCFCTRSTWDEINSISRDSHHLQVQHHQDSHATWWDWAVSNQPVIDPFLGLVQSQPAFFSAMRILMMLHQQQMAINWFSRTFRCIFCQDC